MAKKKWGLEDFEAELAQETGEEVKLGVPMHVAIAEAVDVAAFFAEHWRSNVDDGTLVRPGLDRAGKKLRPSLGQEILALAEHTQRAQTNLILTAFAAADSDSVGRARFLVSELEASLAWHFDDGVEDDKDAQLAAVRSANGSTPDSIDALAAELSDYVGLATKYKAELTAVPDFDADYISEGQAVAKKLRARPDARDKGAVQIAAARTQRNRVLAILVRRVNLVRAAARFIYRNDPAVLRKVTSAYERRRRADNRKADATAPVPPDASAKPTG